MGKPHAKPTQDEKGVLPTSLVNVWAGILGQEIIGPIFLDERLTGASYLRVLQTQVEEMLDEVPLNLLQSLVWQQDGAPPHYEIRVRQYLSEKFPSRWIGRGGPIPWPARSPDLTPCDFYLWGDVKRLVYSGARTEVTSRHELISRIESAFVQVKNNRTVLDRLRGNLRRRAEVCIAQDGAHFEHLLRVT